MSATSPTAGLGSPTSPTSGTEAKPKRGVKAAAKAGIPGTKKEEFEEEKAIKEIPKPIQIVFEILPSSTPLEPGTKESLLRIQTKCEEEQLELYDMSDGKGAACAEISKDEDPEQYYNESILMRDRMKKEEEKAASKPLWMKQLNQKAWNSQRKEDITNFEAGLTKGSVLNVHPRADVIEWNNAMKVTPSTLPPSKGHERIAATDYYQLNNRMSTNVRIQRKLEVSEGRSYNTTRDIDIFKQKTRLDVVRDLTVPGDLTENEKAIVVGSTVLKAAAKFKKQA